ncbi:hypothetical protein LSH36_228g02025, partial [Paralvinella palmiformis]
ADIVEGSRHLIVRPGYIKDDKTILPAILGHYWVAGTVDIVLRRTNVVPRPGEQPLVYNSPTRNCETVLRGTEGKKRRGNETRPGFKAGPLDGRRDARVINHT